MKHSVIEALMETREAFERRNLTKLESITLDHSDGMRFLAEVEDYLGGRHNRRVETVVHVADPPGAIGTVPNGNEIVECRTLTLPHQGVLVQVDGVEHMQVEFMGIKVRWPAVKLALPGGRHLWY